MTVGATERPRRTPTLGVFAVLAVLTAAEIFVASSSVDDRLRSTALTGLLLAKAGILLAFSLRASLRRSASRLTLLAVLVAVAFTVVLMLEAVYRAGVR
jgi:cytochrome c oxidase subunit IV